LIEQIVSSERYTFARDVYTLVLLTRWPDDERFRYGYAVCDLDPVTWEGKKLGVYAHRLVFLNIRAPLDKLPAAVHSLVTLMQDSLDGKVDEAAYGDDVSQRILEQIRRTRLSPEENAHLKEEASWEWTKREERENGFDEGKKLGLQELTMELCEAYGIELTEERQTQLVALKLTELYALRASLKTHKTWLAGERS